MAGRDWNLRAFQGIRLSFVPGRHHDCFLIPVSNAADARGRCALQHGVQVSAWSSPVHLRLVVWVHHGRERPVQLSHFSDSLAVMSGFAVPLSLIAHEHARQAEIGIFELLQVSGFISYLPLITSLMLAFSFLCSTLHVDGAPFNLDRSGFSMVFSCSTVACCLGSQRS